MRQDIQFEKIDVKKQSRLKQTALVFWGFLIVAVILFFTAISVYAYFTSTAKKSGDLTFGTIEVKLLDGESEFLVSSFEEKYLTDLMPGSTINFNDVNVKNTGTHSAYVLLNLDISIPSADGDANKLLHYNKWYNVAGEEVNTTNMVINETKPTLIASGSSLTSNIQWTIPGDVVGNDYKTSTATVNLSVYGTQTNLKEAQAYVDPELYATYFICSNASKIATDNGTTYLGAEITQDPLRKVITSKNLFNVNSQELITHNPYGEVTKTTNGFQTVCETSHTAFRIQVLVPMKHFELGKTYTLSCETSNVSTVYVGEANNAIDTSTCNKYGLNSSLPVSFTITESSKPYLCMYFYGQTYAVGNTIVVSNIQIEEGSTATTYEAYSAVEDTFDFNTKTLTRNVKKVEFTGNELSWGDYGGKNDVEGLSFQYYGHIDKTLGYQMSYCSHFKNIDNAWGIGYTGQTGIYSDHTSYAYQYFRAPKGRSDIDTLAEWKTWLQEQYANGTPVTVWYVSSATEEDKQETILTSKNLYQGNQRLFYKTGDSASTCDSVGRITMTKNAPSNLESQTSELGGDLYDYLYDKEYVVSFKIKRFEDNDAVYLRATAGFYEDGTHVQSNQNVQYYTAEIGEWTHCFLQMQALSTLNLSNVNKVHIWLSATNSHTIRHFEIKDIQIEVGTAPTSFENYDPTEYKRVNGVALRKIGDTKDTYDTNTKKITRNIAEYEFKGNEGWVLENSGADWIECYTFACSDKEYGTNNLCCNRFVVGTSYTSPINSVWGRDDNKAISVTISTDYATNSELLKLWLQKQYEDGNPVTIWYQLATAKTEQLT